MGVPALFRWLSQKYPKIVSPVVEESPREIDGITIPTDITRPNPNGEEMDNLYLDMNGIVHPCSHPEDRPPPATEEEMMMEVFKYTDRVVNMVRPRKLLMIAVDGVAPRAKMNQQRSRRFRSAQEAQEKEEDQAEFLKKLKKGKSGEIEVKKTWDSNAITPGTPFMDILAASLRYWTAYKLNTDPGWATMKVIISDSTVPGEGEHKIMEFIRSQRASPEHDPNTRHVIYGLDADLIMLGLGTHEPHFRVLREDVFFQQGKAPTCRICGQVGHKADECKGDAKQKIGEFDEKGSVPALKPFIWLHVSILREYLAAEMEVPKQPFKFDLERAIDDWVFMCFFVGNDFLPHLPSLDIRENGIDTLIAIWRDNIPIMGGYLTSDGHVNLERAQLILDGLAKQEDAIFQRRKEVDERKEAGKKRRKLNDQNRSNNHSPHATKGTQGNGNSFAASPEIPLFAPGNITKEAIKLTHDLVLNRGENWRKSMENQHTPQPDEAENGDDNSDLGLKSAFAKRRAELMEEGTEQRSALGKRKSELIEADADSTDISEPGTPKRSMAESDEAPPDNIRLWEPGYADRYYENKFKADPKDIAFRHKVARAYVEGLAWVLLYYFQGCPSWTWYYPYHYAPFAADFANLSEMKISFEKGRIFKPFEQLMGVLPAASRHAIPEVFHDLMTDGDSEIIDFYPEDFQIDLNGKKFAWQGVALLPFIDETRLLKAMEKKYPLLSAEEAARNALGKDVLLVSDNHPLYDELASKFYSKKQGPPKFKLTSSISYGLAGIVEKDDSFLPQSSLTFPLGDGDMPDVEDDRSISVFYDMPKSLHNHKSMLLRGIKFPQSALDRMDIQMTQSRASNSGRSYGGVPFRGNHGNGRGRGNFNQGSPLYRSHSSPHLGGAHGSNEQRYNQSNHPPGRPGGYPPSQQYPPGTGNQWQGAHQNSYPYPPPGLQHQAQYQPPNRYQDSQNRGRGGSNQFRGGANGNRGNQDRYNRR